MTPPGPLTDTPTETGDHPLYTHLLTHAGQEEAHRALVQSAYFHRPVLDEMGVWVCTSCSWCTPLASPGDGEEIHQPVSAYGPCEQLRLLAWPFRKRFGYQKRWMPEEVTPTNPPTVLGEVATP